MGDDAPENLLELADKHGLDVYKDEGLCCVGKHWTDIEDDQTAGQFKQMVKDALKNMLHKDVECGTIEETIWS